MASKKKIGILDKKINELIKRGKPTIAFGLKERNAKIIASLKKSKKYAEIILVCPMAIKTISGFKVVSVENPEERLAEMLWNKEVDGIIRGTVDDFKTYETYQKLSGEKNTIDPGIMEDATGRQFFISPVSNPEGWDRDEKLRIASEVAGFMKSWGIKPKIAVFAGTRHDTYKRRKEIQEGIVGVLNKTYADADYVVENLKKAGYDAENWSIDLNPAIEAGCNFFVPVNGMVGNQIGRVVMFSGGKVMACPRCGMSRCYEDNSRTEFDFEPHVRYLTAWINSKKNKK